MDPLNRLSKLPLYQQIYEIVRAELTRGDRKPGDMIPTENELIERFQVSRITIRQVLDLLVKEGLIYRQRGRGSFVAHPPIQQSLTRIVNFTEDMRRRGFQPGTRVLAAHVLPAPADIAGPLRIEPGAELAHIQRLRLADDEPLAIEDSYLIHHLCPGILQQDYAKQSLAETLARVYGLQNTRATQTIRALEADRQVARELTVEPGAALPFIERVSYSQQSVPYEFLRIYYRGDRYSLSTELVA
jgi:GntR family transcriptional regulator